MSYEYIVVKQVTEAAAGVDIVNAMVALVIFAIIMVLLMKVYRSRLLRMEYVNAYFITKLKKHAEKQGLNMEETMKEIKEYTRGANSTEGKTREQKVLEASDTAYTDILFKQLEKEEKEGKKK